jgi:hypothetical protein
MKRQTVRRLLGFSLTAALLAAGLSQCGWVQKIKLDREVDRLCAIDGGVHIYETVFLSRENFGPDGEVFPQYRTRLSSEGGYSSAYRSHPADKSLVEGDPSLRRLNTKFIRVSDGKVVAESIVYVRNGGDPPGPWLGSSYQPKSGSYPVAGSAWGSLGGPMTGAIRLLM